jgi:hypothetical protein
MSLSATIPAGAVDLAVALLLPLILPGLGCDTRAAAALVLQLLAEYEPHTARELRLATEAIGFSIKGAATLAESAEAGIAREKREASIKWACSLTRSGHQAQRRLMELQRAPRMVDRTVPLTEIGQTAAISPTESAARAPTPAAAGAKDAGLPAAGNAAQGMNAALPKRPNASLPNVALANAASSDATHLDTAQPAQVIPTTRVAETSTQPDPAPADVAQAEATYNVAVDLLNLMKARHKGAPPGHSQAAQQIQAQQRIADVARMKLRDARRRQAQFPSPPQAEALAA